MGKLTYQQAYNKIIESYFGDEICPYENEFCFCGSLSLDDKWRNRVNHFINPSRYYYTVKEYARMEYALLSGIINHLGLYQGKDITDWPKDDEGNEVDATKYQNYEDALFYGVKMALAVLKKIHISRGDNVDEVQTKFKKRDINKVTQ